MYIRLFQMFGNCLYTSLHVQIQFPQTGGILYLIFCCKKVIALDKIHVVSGWLDFMFARAMVLRLFYFFFRQLNVQIVPACFLNQNIMSRSFCGF
jgi:hypothetical protein